MPKRNITFLSGFYYHIYNRGSNHEKIFFSDKNYQFFLRLLQKRLILYNIDLTAYCLMPNHFHLLVKPRMDNNLSSCLQTLFTSYSQAINKQQKREGPLFQGRFRAVMIQEEDYLLVLSRYIHLNPVKAGLVKAPQDWSYSNYLEIIGCRDGRLKDFTIVPERFETGESYQKFVDDGIEIAENNIGVNKYFQIED